MHARTWMSRKRYIRPSDYTLRQDKSTSTSLLSSLSFVAESKQTRLLVTILEKGNEWAIRVDIRPYSSPCQRSCSWVCRSYLTKVGNKISLPDLVWFMPRSRLACTPGTLGRPRTDPNPCLGHVSSPYNFSFSESGWEPVPSISLTHGNRFGVLSLTADYMWSSSLAHYKMTIFPALWETWNSLAIGKREDYCPRLYLNQYAALCIPSIPSSWNQN
jgi:hypothetical protein